LLVAALLAAGRPSAGGCWPRFRGPDGAGQSDDDSLPVTWTDRDVNWKVALPGEGYSSPVVWGRNVFLTCADKRTARRIVVCLATADGRERWRREFAGRKHHLHRDNHYASATPALDANSVYVAWASPKSVTLRAMDHAGKDRWQRDLGAFESMHGHGTSPIVVGDLVVLGNDQKGKAFLVAVDRRTGKTRWKLDRRSGLTPASTPCVSRAPGEADRLIFTTTAHGITAVEARTGRVDWEVPKVFRDRCVASPVAGDGIVIGSYGYGIKGDLLVAIRPGSRAAGVEPKVLWELKRAVPLVPTPLIHRGRVFCWDDRGTVTCLDVRTGKLIWRERVEGKFYGSPVRVAGRLYCISKAGEVVVVAAGGTFKLLARVPLGEKSFATPAVADGVMYLRTLRHLISVGGSKR